MKGDLEASLRSLLRERFDLHGFAFRKGEGGFFKTTGEGNVIGVTIDVLSKNYPDAYKISCIAHIRIKAYEDLYAKHHPHVSDKEQNGHFTLNVNCDNLFQVNDAYQIFTVSTPDDLSSYSEKLWDSLKVDVLPVIERLGNNSELAEHFRPDDPREWITGDRMTRFIVLLCDAVVQGRADLFERYAGESVAFFEGDKQRPHRLTTISSIIDGLRKNHLQAKN